MGDCGLNSTSCWLDLKRRLLSLGTEGHGDHSALAVMAAFYNTSYRRLSGSLAFCKSECVSFDLRTEYRRYNLF